MLTHADQAAVWGQHAQQWSRVGPPLKPSAQDGQLTLRALRTVFEQSTGPCRLALLGVTPELVHLPWPSQVQLLAFDHSAQMIAEVWQPSAAVPSIVQLARWQSLPLQDGCMHAAVGDGSLNVLPHLCDYSHVLQELHRVLRPGGLAVVRCFIRAGRSENLSAIVRAVQAREVQSFHALKWRLAMAMAATSGASVAVADIHATFEALFPDRAQLAALTGWHPEKIATMDAYQGVSTRYTFPTLEEMTACCSPHFEVQAVDHAAYELAQCCPTLTLRRRGGTGAQA